MKLFNRTFYRFVGSFVGVVVVALLLILVVGTLQGK